MRAAGANQPVTSAARKPYASTAHTSLLVRTLPIAIGWHAVQSVLQAMRDGWTPRCPVGSF